MELLDASRGVLITLGGILFSPCLELETRQKSLTYNVLFSPRESPTHIHFSFVDSISGPWVCFLKHNWEKSSWFLNVPLLPGERYKIPEAMKGLILFPRSRCLQHLDFGNILRTVSLSNESERYALYLTGPLSPEETLLLGLHPAMFYRVRYGLLSFTLFEHIFKRLKLVSRQLKLHQQ